MLAAVTGPWLAPDNPTLPDLQLAWVGPAAGHLLGFDFEGRDVLSRLLAGAQSSMLGPLVVVALAMAGGAALALTAAWRRGAVDAVISYGEPVAIDGSTDRKALTRTLEGAVRGITAATLNGRLRVLAS